MMPVRQELRPRIGPPARPVQPSSSPCEEGSCRYCTGGVFLAVLTLAIITFATVTIAQTAEVLFDLSIEKGRVPVNMRLMRVRQGDAVKLRWSTDRPILLHLHGYDIETKVEPGAVAEMAFTARATGRFPIEEHRPDAKGGHSHGEAPLARVEVYPR
jgi:hypothetical protein